MFQHPFARKAFSRLVLSLGTAGLALAPALSQRLSEVIAGLQGQKLSVLISQSEHNHSRKLFDSEHVIERGANHLARAEAAA